MRTIKFRGKTPEDNRGNALKNTWLYGDLDTISEPSPRIRILKGNDIYNIAVCPETVGQFTGLLDKNGKEIYEGDIVSMESIRSRINKVVIWNEKRATYDAIDNNGRIDLYVFQGCEVIGNIYDNPELLK